MANETRQSKATTARPRIEDRDGHSNPQRAAEFILLMVSWVWSPASGTT